MQKVAFRYTKISGHPCETSWRDIKELTPENIREGDVIEYAYAEPVVTDEMGRRALKSWLYERGRAVLGIEGNIQDDLGMMMRALTAALEPDNA